MALPTHPISSLGDLVQVTLYVAGTPSRPMSSASGKPMGADKRERTVSFFVPHAVNNLSHTPLLIAFHGSTENGNIFRTRTTNYGYDQLAIEESFIVAYPDGYKGNWNDSRRAVSYPAKVENIDDVAFTKAIIEYASKRWYTSMDKTLLAGYSNGGHQVMKLTLELGSAYIAAAAVHCANLPAPENSDCHPRSHDAVPIIFLNGTADPVNPFNGGEVALAHGSSASGSAGGRGAHRSAIGSVDYFAQRFAMCGVRLGVSEGSDRRGTMEVRQYRDYNGRVMVKLLAMVGEGHMVPTAAGEKKALVIGPRRGAVHAPREVVHFFQQATYCFSAPRMRAMRTDSYDSVN